MSISVRAAGSPAQLARSVAESLALVDRNLSVSFRPLELDVHAALTQERLIAALSGFFAALALLLCSLGLYGVTAYAVTRRRTELGIRIALGSTPAGAMRLVLSRILSMVGIGLTIGIAIALWTSKLIAALLYGLGARDPVMLVGSAIALAAVATLASLTAALRATRIDPAVVLRQT